MDENRKLSSWRKENWICLTAVALCLVYCLFLVTMGAPYYHTNDDVALNDIAAGNTGENPGLYTPFVMFFYNLFLKSLYGIAGGINWYGVFPTALAVLAFVCVTLVLMKQAPDAGGLILSLGFLGIFGIWTLVEFQFTRLAGFFTAAGLFLMYAGLGKRERFYGWMAGIGFLLGLNGYFLRSEAFLLTAAILGLCCLIKILRLKFWQWKPREIFLQALPFLILLLLVGICMGINAWVCARDPGWQYWEAYNAPRSQLLDFPILPYGEYAREYNALGIFEEDYDLLTRWNYADRNVFSLEKLEELTALQEAHWQSVPGGPAAFLMEFIKAVFAMLRQYRGLLLIAGCGVGLMLWKKKNLWLILPLEALGLALLYLFQLSRMPFRTYMGMWAGLALVLALTAMEGKKPQEGGLLPVLAVVLSAAVFLAPEAYALRVAGVHRTEEFAAQQENTQWRDRVAQDRDSLYVTETFSSLHPGSQLALAPVPLYDSSNLYFLGGWLNPSPLTENILKAHGIGEGQAVKALLEEDKAVYYVEALGEVILEKNSRNLMRDYLRRHYDENARYESVDLLEGQASVTRFYSDPDLFLTDPHEILKAYGLDSAPVSPGLEASLQAEAREGSITVTGWVRDPAIDPYVQRSWLLLEGGGEILCIRGKKTPDPALTEQLGDLHGAAAGVTFVLQGKLPPIDSVTLFLEGRGQAVRAELMQ